MTPFIFDFSGFSSVAPYGLLEVQAHLLHLHVLGDLRRTCLTHPCCSLVSIPSASSYLDFFWRLFCVFSQHSLSCLFGVSLAISSTLSKRIPGAPWHACLTLYFSWQYPLPVHIHGLMNRLMLS